MTSFGWGSDVSLFVQCLMTCHKGQNVTKVQCIVSLILEIVKRQDTWPEKGRQDKFLSSMSWCVVGAHRFFAIETLPISVDVVFLSFLFFLLFVVTSMVGLFAYCLMKSITMVADLVVIMILVMSISMLMLMIDHQLAADAFRFSHSLCLRIFRMYATKMCWWAGWCLWLMLVVAMHLDAEVFVQL